MSSLTYVGRCPKCNKPTHINTNFKHGQTFYCRCGNLGHVTLEVIWDKEK